MEKQYIEILSIPFVNIKRNELIDGFIVPAVLKKQKTFIVTANPEIVEYANKHNEYKKLIKTADFIVPDGIGIIIASKILRKPLLERITGYDLLFELLDLANKYSLNVYFLGAEKDVIEKAANILQNDYPSMNLVGYHHGYIDINDDALAESIAECKPDIIITALGFPRQEEWVCKYYDIFDKGIFIGVGGSFDVISGKVKGAPEVWKKMNLEWLYRLTQQPSRWKRMLVIPMFIFRVICARRK